MAATDVAGESFDLVVLGSGAAGLSTAVTAALSGLTCLVLEHLDVLGGTSARSSGTIWIPGNRHAPAPAGDAAEARSYLEALAGEPRQQWETFLRLAPRMEADLAARGAIAFRPFPAAPDYRQDAPGAAQGWRALEPLAFDGRLLGERFVELAPPLPELTLLGGMMVTRAEAGRLVSAERSPAAAWLGVRLLARHARDRLRWPRGTRLVTGNALVARLLAAALSLGVEVRRGVATASLLRRRGGVVGVATEGGARIAARRGVVLAGGGFPASAAWRARELPRPTPHWTPASPGAVGRTIELALEAGAALGPSLGDNALWFPSSVAVRADGTTAVYPHIVLDRGRPGALVVDRRGRRFVNEAVSYHEFVRGMYRAGEDAIPAWMICGRNFIRRYGLGVIRPRTPSLRRYVRSGYLVEAATLTELAERLPVPVEALSATVERFDGFARAGVDADFHRGETSYERAAGDPGRGPNPCLGPIGPGPFYAVELHPTPLGTSRGLLADANALVLDGHGRAIPGLYVCGNDMQSVFGGAYPGAGAQLGPAMTFGWIAARHAAGVEAT